MSDSKKAPIDLVPLRALIGAARVFEFGNTKKDRKPGDFIDRPLDGVFYASTMRHAMELQRLQGGVSDESLGAIDVESGLPTIDHLICNLLIIRTMAIRDGILPEDPKCEQHSQIAAKRKWANETCADALAYAWQGAPSGFTRDHWSSMSAELEPASLPPAPSVTALDFMESVVAKTIGFDNEPMQALATDPNAFLAGSGPHTCGIVDCRACKAAEDDDTTNKYNTPGTVRAEGMRW